MSANYRMALEICNRHADRLAWAMTQLKREFPFNADLRSSKVKGSGCKNQDARVKGPIIISHAYFLLAR